MWRHGNAALAARAEARAGKEEELRRLAVERAARAEQGRGF